MERLQVAGNISVTVYVVFYGSSGCSLHINNHIFEQVGVENGLRTR